MGKLKSQTRLENMKASGVKIDGKAKESSSGPVEMFTKASTGMASETVTER